MWKHAGQWAQRVFLFSNGSRLFILKFTVHVASGRVSKIIWHFLECLHYPLFFAEEVSKTLRHFPKGLQESLDAAVKISKSLSA